MPQEFGDVTMGDDHGVPLTWRLPTNVRAGPLRAFIADHLDVLERVHLGHAVDWDGRNSMAALDDDAQVASEEFRVALGGYADDPGHVIWPADPAVWFEDSSAQFVGLGDDAFEAVVRHFINSGKPFQVDWTWVVIDLDQALAFAWKIRDEAADLTDE